MTTMAHPSFIQIPQDKILGVTPADIASIYEKMIKDISFDAIYELKKNSGDDKWRKKYLDVKGHLSVAIRRALSLGLDKAGPLQILDIGTGTGYFPLVCEYLGHECKAVDIEIHDLFNKVIELLKVDRMVFEVKAGEPMAEFPHRFDIITAFAIGFSRFEDGSRWKPKDWEYLLDDLKENHLNPGGLIWFWLNPAYLGGARYDDELLDFFLGYGASVKEQHVVLKI